LGDRRDVLLGRGPRDELLGRRWLKVEVVEVMGSDQYVYGQVSEESLTVRLEPHFKVASGDRLRLQVDTHQLHLFDPETEVAVN
jgi:multiple sugar transport system ATP-binding protein